MPTRSVYGDLNYENGQPQWQPLRIRRAGGRPRAELRVARRRKQPQKTALAQQRPSTSRSRRERGGGLLESLLRSRCSAGCRNRAIAGDPCLNNSGLGWLGYHRRSRIPPHSHRSLDGQTSSATYATHAAGSAESTQSTALSAESSAASESAASACSVAASAQSVATSNVAPAACALHLGVRRAVLDKGGGTSELQWGLLRRSRHRSLLS